MPYRTHVVLALLLIASVFAAEMWWRTEPGPESDWLLPPARLRVVVRCPADVRPAIPELLRLDAGGHGQPFSAPTETVRRAGELTSTFAVDRLGRYLADWRVWLPAFAASQHGRTGAVDIRAAGESHDLRVTLSASDLELPDEAAATADRGG